MPWGRPFTAGVSGNPAGRPRTGEALAEYIRKLGGPDGKLYVDELHALATNPHVSEQLRLKALDVLLDRGYGRPPQAIDLLADATAQQVSVSAELLASRLTPDELEMLEAVLTKLGSDTKQFCP